GVSAGAASANDQPVAVGTAFANEVLCRSHTIVDIRDAPLSIEPFPVGPAVSGRASVVHIDEGKPARRPELQARVQGGGGASGGTAMAEGNQRWFFPFRGLVFRTHRRVVEGVTLQSSLGRKGEF